MFAFFVSATAARNRFSSSSRVVLSDTPLIVLEIWKVIADIRASGIATLIVDRDYRKVLAHSDQALVLQKGLAELAGPADKVASDPALPKLLGV